MPEVLLPRAGLSWEMPGLFLWRSARACHHPVGGKHIAGVYIFEARPAGWTGIEDCLCPR
jgi:hypothetical protein